MWDKEQDVLNEAAAATGSNLRDTFFISNYTEDHEERNPEIEKIAFDILDCALMSAERAVQIMKEKEKNKTVGMFQGCIFIQKITYNHFLSRQLLNFTP